jgi:alpha-N-arabinofuranosidase
MRDALVAGLTLNYLNDRCDRVRMANIAQTVNVLQALIFTDGDKMLLTPTYHIFEMYKVHQDALMLPVEAEVPEYAFGGKTLPAITASASKSNDGRIHLSLVNIDPEKAVETVVDFQGATAEKVSARILSSEKINSHNTFENPGEVVTRVFGEAVLRGGQVKLELPPHSVVMLEIK